MVGPVREHDLLRIVDAAQQTLRVHHRLENSIQRK
jgi:hypothetical protein